MHRLVDELKRESYQSSPSPIRNHNQWSIAGVYVDGTQKRQESSKITTINTELKRQVKELKAELALKDNELLNTQMATKYLRVTELETQVISLQSEVANLNQRLSE